MRGQDGPVEVAMSRPAYPLPIRWLVVAWACLAPPVAFVAAAMLDRRLTQAGRADLHQLGPGMVVYVVALWSALAVGATLIVRRPGHPVGWIFLTIGTDLAIGGVAQSLCARWSGRCSRIIAVGPPGRGDW